MTNLLSNAWKFTGQHPKARIEFGVTQVDGKENIFTRANSTKFNIFTNEKSNKTYLY